MHPCLIRINAHRTFQVAIRDGEIVLPECHLEDGEYELVASDVPGSSSIGTITILSGKPDAVKLYPWVHQRAQRPEEVVRALIDAFFG